MKSKKVLTVVNHSSKALAPRRGKICTNISTPSRRNLQSWEMCSLLLCLFLQVSIHHVFVPSYIHKNERLRPTTPTGESAVPEFA